MPRSITVDHGTEFMSRALEEAQGEFEHAARLAQKARERQLLRRHEGPIASRARLGGLLKYYHRSAA